MLLHFLTQWEVFEEPSPGRFALGPLGEVMAAPLRLPLRAMLDVEGAQSRFGMAGAGLAHSVRTGRAGYPRVFGHPFWDDLAADPELGRAFHDLMAFSAGRWVPRAVVGWPWSTHQHVVDVGGGTGDLLISLLRANPTMCGTLVEQPAVAAKARRKLSQAALGERTTVHPGSFFDPLPTGGDAYILAQVLHDWPDTDAVAILRRCAEAAGPSGRVLLIERVVADAHPAAAHADMDLLMMILFGSAERTKGEFRALAAAAGLRLGLTARLGLGVWIIECRPDPGRTDPGRTDPGRTDPGRPAKTKAKHQERS
jgi:hypothetical protein